MPLPDHAGDVALILKEIRDSDFIPVNDGPRPVIVLVTPVRAGLIPVSKPYRDAVQVALGECASVKRNPFLAS